MSNSFTKIVGELEKAELCYIVVGGLAAVMHGCNRTTNDIDIIVDFDEASLNKLNSSMENLGFKPRLPVNPADLASKEIRLDWVENKNMQVFTFIDPDDPIFLVDIFVTHPIPFSELLARSLELPFNDGKIRIASISDLIAMKEIAGRPKDLQDIEDLKIIQSNE